MKVTITAALIRRLHGQFVGRPSCRILITGSGKICIQETKNGNQYDCKICVTPAVCHRGQACTGSNASRIRNFGHYRDEAKKIVVGQSILAPGVLARI